MISLLENSLGPIEQSHSFDQESASEEEQLVNLIYRFANKKDEWFNLLLSLSNCISISQSLPEDHPYQDLSDRLLAHLKNAIKISTRLNTSSAFFNYESIETASVLNQIPMAVGIVDINGRIVEINQHAKDQVEQFNEWTLHHGYLHAQHLNLSEELTAFSNSEDQIITLPVTQQFQIKNSKSSDKQTLSQTPQYSSNLHITRIPANDSMSGERETTPRFYFCFQANKFDLVNTKSLKKHYQLTDSEALVVATMVQEISSKKTASKLKLKEATVRGHLSSIYIKFGVKRKPELIRKVLLHSLFERQESSQSKQVGLKAVTNHYDQSFAIYLRDGRKMSYVDHQPVKTKVSSKKPKETILLLHNLMGSGCELPPGSEHLLVEKNLRFLVPERPGYGDSDPLPNRKHQDWCEDVEELLDTLKIEKVKVIAHSIGGVYALALAEYLPDRVERISMVNAVTRPSDMAQAKPVPALVTAVFRSIHYAPFLIEPILKMAVGKNIEHFYEQQLSYIRPTIEGRAADVNLLNTQEYRDYSIRNLKQSSKQGIAIWANELKLSFSDWQFEPSNSKVEYQFWHGDNDDVISVKAAINLAKELNTVSFNRLENETHFLFSRHFNQVVDQLISPESFKASNDVFSETNAIKQYCV